MKQKMLGTPIRALMTFIGYFKMSSGFVTLLNLVYDMTVKVKIRVVRNVAATSNKSKTFPLLYWWMGC